MTSPITLFFAPYTCARVPLVALEEIGVPFDTHTVAFMAGDHKKADYLAVNPKGKVPALLIDGHSLTENVAILTYLDMRFPKAKLLTTREKDADLAEHLADLGFCAATLHPNLLPYSASAADAACRILVSSRLARIAPASDGIEIGFAAQRS
ncbi:MAG: glutathione S-transferase N-terminal domain-containing protein [Sphingomicrobium sp.]